MNLKKTNVLEHGGAIPPVRVFLGKTDGRIAQLLPANQLSKNMLIFAIYTFVFQKKSHSQHEVVLNVSRCFIGVAFISLTHVCS